MGSTPISAEPNSMTVFEADVLFFLGKMHSLGSFCHRLFWISPTICFSYSEWTTTCHVRLAACFTPFEPVFGRSCLIEQLFSGGDLGK
jgi:hypothetical protein